MEVNHLFDFVYNNFFLQLEKIVQIIKIWLEEFTDDFVVQFVDFHLNQNIVVENMESNTVVNVK